MFLAKEKKYEACGKIMWLWAQSEMHRSWNTALQAQFILPAVDFGQFHIIEAKGIPVAYCSWAHMNLEAEARYIVKPTSLKLADWVSGDRLWFIDWISPFEMKYTWALQRSMKKLFPKVLGRAYRVKSNKSKGARIAVFAGRELTHDESREKRANYFTDLRDKLKEKDGQGFRFRHATSDQA